MGDDETMNNGKELFKSNTCPELMSLGIPVFNTILDGDGFYISYNRSTRDYGCVTTALVVADGINMETFLVLRGDHRVQYANVVKNGLDACLSYYKAHIDEAHEYSEKIEDIGKGLEERFGIKLGGE